MGGGKYTLIVFLRLFADFGVSLLNYFSLNSRHPSYQILATYATGLACIIVDTATLNFGSRLKKNNGNKIFQARPSSGSRRPRWPKHGRRLDV